MPATRPARPARPEADDSDARKDSADTREETASTGRRPARRAAPEGTPRRTPRPRDEDEADSRDDKGDEPAPKVDVAGGWDAFRQNRAKSSGIPDTFKVDEDESYIICFLSNIPFANFRQHWIERKGKKSFLCLETECPLCEILGDEPKAQACFNIAVFEEVVIEGEKFIEPHVRVWEVGTGIGTDLEKLDSDDKMGPLDKGYWRVSKSRASAKGGSFKYSILPIKERDLDEDFGISPITDDEMAELQEKAYDKDYLKFNTRGELRTIAREES